MTITLGIAQYGQAIHLLYLSLSHSLLQLRHFFLLPLLPQLLTLQKGIKKVKKKSLNLIDQFVTRYVHTIFTQTKIKEIARNIFNVILNIFLCVEIKKRNFLQLFLSFFFFLMKSSFLIARHQA